MAKQLDGLDIFSQACAGLKIDVMALLESSVRWVAPETFELLPVWYPEYARGAAVYKDNWQNKLLSKRGGSRRADTVVEDNEKARMALDRALDNSIGPNWSCFHIWGGDHADENNLDRVIQGHRYYSCLANMVAVPTPFKGCVETLPEIRYALRFCAFYLYGWHCPQPEFKAEVDKIRAGEMPKNYPKTWPSPSKPDVLPLGTVALSAGTRAAAETRLQRIYDDLSNDSLRFYPREKVLDVLKYFEIEVIAKAAA